MSEASLPSVKPYKRHVFVCTGSKCAPETSSTLYKNFKDRLRELDLDRDDVRIQRSQSQCLGVCEGGPIVLVYPEGIWYHHLTEEKLEQVLQEHLIGGKPVKEYILYEKK